MPRHKYTQKDYKFKPKCDCTAFRPTATGGVCKGLKQLFCAVEGECSFYCKSRIPLFGAERSTKNAS